MESVYTYGYRDELFVDLLIGDIVSVQDLLFLTLLSQSMVTRYTVNSLEPRERF